MYNSYTNFICQKCGSVMIMKCGYGYYFYWQCPNGCNNNHTFQYTTSSKFDPSTQNDANALKNKTDK